MKRKINESAEQLDEFDSGDGQSHTADPIPMSSARPADKSDGELAIPGFATKVEAINAIVQLMSSMPKGQVADIFRGMTDQSGLDKSKSKRGADQDNGEDIASTYRSPTSVRVSSAEDIQAIFGEDGEELSEEVMERATVVFEAAVNAKVTSEIVRIEEENEAYLEETIESIRQELVESVDKYLTYAVEEWVKENTVPIHSALKSEVTEEFITGLKGLFETHYIDIPEDKVDVVEELTSRVDELEARLNEEMEKNIDPKSAVMEAEIDATFDEMAEGLAMTQVAKLKSLAEGLDYNSVDDFANKLEMLKETYFPSNKPASTKVSTAKVLTEETDYEDDTLNEAAAPVGVMKLYSESLTRLAKK